MTDSYKTIYTENDFDIMNWHDVAIHALSISKKEYSYELALDIDYIFEWISPVPPDKYFKFLIAPATLIFNDVWDIKINLATRESILENVSILNLERNFNENHTKSDWTILLEQGTIKFNASGYIQYTRRKPILFINHVLSVEQRGELSFGKECV